MHTSSDNPGDLGSLGLIRDRTVDEGGCTLNQRTPPTEGHPYESRRRHHIQ